MELLPVIREMMDHNYWARDRQLQACATLSQEQLLHAAGGSFGSLRDTLAHLVAVEWIWLERWRGGHPAALIPAGEFASLAAITERWNAVEKEMRAYMSGVDEETVTQSVSYVNLRGMECTYPLWRMMLHLWHHQGYHRGQVTTLLRMQGAPAPGVDYLVAQDMRFRLD